MVTPSLYPRDLLLLILCTWLREIIRLIMWVPDMNSYSEFSPVATALDSYKLLWCFICGPISATSKERRHALRFLLCCWIEGDLQNWSLKKGREWWSWWVNYCMPQAVYQTTTGDTLWSAQAGIGSRMCIIKVLLFPSISILLMTGVWVFQLFILCTVCFSFTKFLSVFWV